MKKLLLFILWLGFAESMGQAVNNFELVNVLDNQKISMNTFSSSEGMVLIFTSNNCPYDEYYRKRIAEISQAYPARIPVLLINSHAEPDESAEKMAAKARELGLGVPYLADKKQVLMANLDVRKSPEALLLKNENGKFTVVYRGAIDDNAQVEADVRHHYLLDAIDLLLAKKKITTPQVRPVGCNIKKAANTKG